MTFAATCMDLDIIMLSEVKQCYQHHILSLMWNLKKKKKKDTMNLFAEQKLTHGL